MTNSKDLVLNLTFDNRSALERGLTIKGGRWTDRLQAKRASKRKRCASYALSHSVLPLKSEDFHKKKRSCIESSKPSQISQKLSILPAKSTQITSSLFSSNPIVEEPLRNGQSKISVAPSNAPLRDSSTFTSLGLHPLLVAHLEKKMKITRPTPIQRATLPPLIGSLSDPGDEKDIFLQAETGSGKTLSFLLPVLHDLLSLSLLSHINRSIGTLAIIIAPTRELAKQISDVLENLLQFHSSQDISVNRESLTISSTRWLISGLLKGGATRNHEKSRLRKGLPILVSTPGRLLDHLQNTSSFNVSKCRWLILDEADRLMDLGFEETISGIMEALEGRQNLVVMDGKSLEIGGWDKRRRRTILCSATIRENVQRLAGFALLDPMIIRAIENNKPYQSQKPEVDHAVHSDFGADKFSTPAQLLQKYIVTPLKLRLVVLVALLRSLTSRSTGCRTSNVIIFFSCTASVDFYWNLLVGAYMDKDDHIAHSSSEDNDAHPERKEKFAGRSSLFPDTILYRLHGNLSPITRVTSIRQFSLIDDGNPNFQKFSILFCTSVASRGLDLPLVNAVIQYDLPTEGGVIEYVHRAGRTARAGRGGEVWSIVLPSETEWVKRIEREMQKGRNVCISEGSDLERVGMQYIFEAGFGGEKKECEKCATDVQLSFERWVLRRKLNVELARKAFLSHMRAYATHPYNEKNIFHLRQLHLGHLAKSFALRDAPKIATTSHKVMNDKKIQKKKNRNGMAKKKVRMLAI